MDKFTSDVQKLKEILAEHEGECSPDSHGLLLRFYELVLRENEVQNLTRLSTPADFYFGHILDVLEFQKSGIGFEYPVLDIGSGAGVPGIVAAILGKGSWVLSDSEKKKADFLSRTVAELGLSKVLVNRLKISKIHEYRVQEKIRKIVFLERVPRGTK